ncbi:MULTISPECIES: hypothetical protein [Stenotrophomonas]|uniref:hypothetical protein n=1 Tax=Stenotrophomonas TaxID=40323 RepID=UPI000B21D193|nr:MULTISPECIES: hypothetical protein [Stenotrophomonas]
MSAPYSGPYEALRKALHGLPATGHPGFEGFIGHVLSAITGIGFRLAASGQQDGTDGDSAQPVDFLSYECKRHDAHVDSQSVLSKLAELSTRQDVDLWVLAGTAPVHSQLARKITAIGQAQSLETLVLDWTETTSLPPLAVACAMVASDVLEFMSSGGLSEQDLQCIRDELGRVPLDERFLSHSDAIRAQLDTARLGLEGIRQRNIAWMQSRLSDRDTARIAFGQPLAPRAATKSHTLARPRITSRVQSFLRGEGNQSPLFILGNEGVGKSWAVAQAWALESEPPALFICSADQFMQIVPGEAIKVVAKIIAKQCGAQTHESENIRWQRKLERWLSTTHHNVRFLIYLDGINQQQTVDWARLIDALDAQIRPAGGRVIVSSRRAYFDSYLSGRLMSTRPHTISVPQWDEEERDAILRQRGLDPAIVTRMVLESLRNPRLLGIALDLLDNEAIASLEQLDIGTLLFAHLLAANQSSQQPMPAHLLVRRLSDHAKQLIAKVNNGQFEDLLIFEDLESVVEEHYFHPIEHDPTRYILSQDGLRLALALAVLDHLRQAMRNGRPLVPSALALIDPVAALDDASGVVLAALSISCADDKESDQIRIALLVAFAEMQNPSHDDLAPFIARAITRPATFMEAAYTLCLGRNNRPNLNWIKLAIWDAASNTAAWTVVSDHLLRWLRTHTLDPTRVLSHRHGDDPEQLKTKLQEAADKLDNAIDALTPAERPLLDSLNRVTEDSAPLHELAIALMAGRPLAPFADAFAAFALGCHLDPTPFTAVDRLTWICRLNTVDWPAMREAILMWADRLTGAESSPSARWSGATLLYMTGHPEDAIRGYSLRMSMSQRMTHWQRLKRSWRAMDASDVNSSEPEDLDECEQRFRELPVSKLSLTFGVTSEDHTFREALAPLARFRPDIAISKIRELAIDAPTRSGMPFRQGLLKAHKHGAALTPEIATTYLKLRERDLLQRCTKLSSEHPALLSSTCLDLALPHITPEQQLEAFSFEGADRHVWHRLVAKFKAAELQPQDIDTALAMAIDSRKDIATCYLLCLLSTIPMLDSRGQTALDLPHSSCEMIRIHALALIEAQGTRFQLQQFVASEWDAAGKSAAEAYYGSLVLLRALSEADADLASVARRITPDLFGALATASDTGAKLCAEFLESNIRHALRSTIPPPAVDISVNDSIDGIATNISVSTKPSAESIADAFRNFGDLAASETEDREKSDVFNEFVDMLEAQKVSFVLRPLTPEQTASILRACPERIDHWIELLLPPDSVPNWICKGIALAFAAHLAADDADTALRLIDGYTRVDDIVTRSFGFTRLDMLQQAIWSSTSSEEFNLKRRNRLALASNDAALAQEVMAAERWGHTKFLDDLVREWVSAPEPALRARAISIQGWRGLSDVWPAELEAAAGTVGFLAQVHTAAKNAHDKNRNARYWYEKMCHATTSVDFWRSMTLMSNTVDHRTDLWREIPAQASKWVSIYEADILDATRNAIRHQKSKLERTLYGINKPPQIYLIKPHEAAPGKRLEEIEGAAL